MTGPVRGRRVVVVREGAMDRVRPPGSVVAVAQHISTSYLHRPFREDGVAVAAWIRRRRLERARRVWQTRR